MTTRRNRHTPSCPQVVPAINALQDLEEASGREVLEVRFMDLWIMSAYTLSDKNNKTYRFPFLNAAEGLRPAAFSEPRIRQGADVLINDHHDHGPIDEHPQMPFTHALSFLH